MALKVTAIQNINKALQHPGVMPNDYVMVAVACITIFEASVISASRDLD